MRISDWSSDVCSSDLIVAAFAGIAPFQKVVGQEGDMGAEGIRSEGRLRPLLGNGRGRKEKSRHRGENFEAHKSPMKEEWRVLSATWPRRRSEARRVGEECGSTCRSRWKAYQ